MRRSSKFVIPSEAWSDDRHVTVKFDALPFFHKKNRQKILALSRAYWGLAYAADAVADYCTDKPKPHKALVELFTYLRIRNSCGSVVCGLECRVDGVAAMSYLKDKWPKLHKEIEDYYKLQE